MKCFFCDSDQSVVIDKREVQSRGEIRRRRKCLKCQRRYTTYERVCQLELYVIKRDGRRELFNKEKLSAGIKRALEKRPDVKNLPEIVNRIIKKIILRGKKETESKFIGQAILTELKKLDQVAYLRFASVYRNFNNPDDFTKELEHLKV